MLTANQREDLHAALMAKVKTALQSCVDDAAGGVRDEARDALVAVEDLQKQVAAMRQWTDLADKAWWGRAANERQFVAFVSVARALGVDADYRKPEDIAAECLVAVERLRKGSEVPT